MKKSVCSAEINECTEIGNVLDNTVYDIANLDLAEESLLHLFLLSCKKLLAVSDASSLVRIVLNDNEVDFLSEIFAEIFLIAVGNKACRDEDSGSVNLNGDSALKDSRNLSGKDFLIIESFFDTLVSLLLLNSLIGYDNLTFTIVNLENLYLKLVSGLDCLVRSTLLSFGIFILA